MIIHADGLPPVRITLTDSEPVGIRRWVNAVPVGYDCGAYVASDDVHVSDEDFIAQATPMLLDRLRKDYPHLWNNS